MPVGSVLSARVRVLLWEMFSNTWGWFTSPWDKSVLPNPCPSGDQGHLYLGHGHLTHILKRKRREKALGLKTLFLFPGWCWMMMSSILIPQFHKLLVFCWFQWVLAPFPLGKPFFPDCFSAIWVLSACRWYTALGQNWKIKSVVQKNLLQGYGLAWVF